jgi:hypothetical protein
MFKTFNRYAPFKSFKPSESRAAIRFTIETEFTEFGAFPLTNVLNVLNDWNDLNAP